MPGDGLHSVTCQLSGAIGRGHSALKLTVYKIAKAAGMDVTLEASPPGNPSVRPGDILIQNWQGKGPLAVDFTIVTPSIRNARNAASASESNGSRLDAAAELKLKKSKEVCTVAILALCGRHLRCAAS